MLNIHADCKARPIQYGLRAQVKAKCKARPINSVSTRLGQYNMSKD